MILLNYVYDLVLNFSDFYLPFYEWNSDDEYDYLDKIPLIRVSTMDIINFENYEIKVDDKFLDLIKNKSILKNDLLESIEYACVLSDSYNSIAIEFNKNGKSIYKSYFLIDDDLKIARACRKSKVTKINYEVLDRTLYYDELKQIIQIKNNLLNMLEDDYKHKHNDKIMYLFLEIYNKNIDNVDEAYCSLKKLINDSNNKNIIKINKIINCV